ncbi:hypothetical protein [Nocardia stercoris]|uniref:Uncharacterized protein n=1 Tax=Nocardia stercoris TaxID=2483361 RepID=A0A3M2LJ85_9NOCA|nr:hypothetical protein [Nocardia stercoris]RMI34828.1 hypothetical protein EBN03_00095 [Nocardia stercoris]
MCEEVYRERAHLVAHLSAIYPSVRVDDPGEPEAPTVVTVFLPTGPVGWHVKDRDLALFAHVPYGENHYDGYDTAEKYRRLDAATRDLAARRE